MSNKHSLDSDTEREDPSSSVAKRPRKSIESPPADSSVPTTNGNGKQAAPTREEDVEMQEEEQESEEESEGEQRRTQRARRKARKEKGKVGRIAKAGVLEQVDLTNFMCHDLVTMELGPQINFIVGHNGSGKSAILAGITMALGGNARATDRASSGKGFVKDDRNSAICSVRLSNRGDQAFKPEIYGETITIERKLTREGPGGYYKVKDHSGKVHGKNKAAVEAITDHYNIQVDNPLTVLTQDSARKFLADSTAKEKYQFFLKGTQLQQLTGEYETIAASLAVTADILERKRVIIPELKLAYKKAKDKATAAKAAMGNQGRVEKLQVELAWAFADEHEGNMKDAEEFHATTVRHGEKIIEQLEQFKRDKSTAEEEVKVCEMILEDTNAQIAELEAQRLAVKKDIGKHSADYGKNKDEQREITGQIQRMEADLMDCEAKIAFERSRLAKAAGADQEPIIREIKSLEVQLSDNGIEITKKSHVAEQLATALENGREEFHTRGKAVKAIEQEILGLQTDLQRLQRSTTDALHAFDGAVAMKKEIDACRAWKNKPLGPIGTFVKIKPEFMRYAAVIESVFGKHLNAYVVNNPQDREELMRLFKRARISGTVISERPDPNFDFSRGEPDPQFVTILRALEYSNPFIRQVSITSLHLEKAILVKDRADADNVMRHPPQNVESCFTSQLFKVGGIEGGSATSAMRPWKGNPRLSQDIAGVIKQKEVEIAEAKQRYQAAREALAQIDRSQTDIAGQKKLAEDEIRRVGKRNLSINDRLERLRNSLKKQDVESNLDVLVELKETAEREIASTKDQYQPLKDQIAAMDAVSAPLKKQKDDIDEALRKAKKTLARTSSAVETPLSVVVQNRSSIEQYEAKLKKNEADLEGIRKEMAPFADLLATMIEQAQVVGERPVLAKKRDPKKVTTEIDALKKEIARQDKENGASFDDLMLELARRKQTATDAIEQMDDLNAFLAAITVAYRKRCEKWDQFRHTIGSRARMTFVRNLEHRGFSGKLGFDHLNCNLTIRVQTDSIAGMKKDAKALSGGEKSFSTICLLMTLWEAVGSPLRCLDEFDVFMDALNRRISVEMIVHMALATDDTQFVLITPQSVKADTFGPGVKVCKMADPRVEA